MKKYVPYSGGLHACSVLSCPAQLEELIGIWNLILLLCTNWIWWRPRQHGRGPRRGVELVVVITCLELSPLLQLSINLSVVQLLKYLTGSAKTYSNSVQAYVCLKDVTLTHVLIYKNPKSSGRYLCAEFVLHCVDLCDTLSKLFPQYPIHSEFSNKVKPRKSFKYYI